MLCVCQFPNRFCCWISYTYLNFRFDYEVNDGSVTFFTGQSESFTRQGGQSDEKLLVCLQFVVEVAFFRLLLAVVRRMCQS